MSYVANIILVMSGMADIDHIHRLNAYLSIHEKGELAAMQYGECGGYKSLEVSVFTGAFNYLDIEEFVRLWSCLPWNNCVITWSQNGGPLETSQISNPGLF